MAEQHIDAEEHAQDQHVPGNAQHVRHLVHEVEPLEDQPRRGAIDRALRGLPHDDAARQREQQPADAVAPPLVVCADAERNQPEGEQRHQLQMHQCDQHRADRVGRVSSVCVLTEYER